MRKKCKKSNIVPKNLTKHIEDIVNSINLLIRVFCQPDLAYTNKNKNRREADKILAKYNVLHLLDGAT